MSSSPNPASETFGQARQGSVAAIIQILNERLSDSGIRTRAVVAEGMLQILCEAPSTDQLEKTTVVDRVRQILENISPQHIKKVNINSRIVKEEQLLWLEEISRDPENSLLWSEVITLKRPFFVKRWIRDRNLKPAGPVLRDISAPEPQSVNLPSKLIGGVAVTALILGTAWVFREEIGSVGQLDDVAPVAVSEDTVPNADGLPPLPSAANTEPAGDAGERSADTTPPVANNLTTQATPPSTTEKPADDSAAADDSATTDNDSAATAVTEPAPTPTQTPTPTANSSGATADAFAEAVRIANQASTDGLTASTTAEWLDLAARWQRASDLMAQIPQGSEQYDQARERVQSYADNSQTALQKASAQP